MACEAKYSHLSNVCRPAGGAAAAAGTPGASPSGAAGSPAGAVDPLAQAMGGLSFGAGAGGQADMMQQMMQSPMAQVGWLRGCFETDCSGPRPVTVVCATR